MRILGVTAKDKGTQLESLVKTELLSQGYEDLATNVVGPGGNELDVVGVRKLGLMGASHVIPLLCEAKAYIDPIDMPTWQRFLGKLFLQRAVKPTTLGMLVALNGVNGNVRGSFNSLVESDERVFIFDGAQLLSRASESGEIAAEAEVLAAVEARFGRRSTRVEAAYYGGGYFWIAWWGDDEYSIIDAHGAPLSVATVDRLRDALAGSIGGSLISADDAQAQAEALHSAIVGLISRLLRGEGIASDQLNENEREAFESLGGEPYVRRAGGNIWLRSASELDGDDVGSLFKKLFENRVPLKHFDFMIEQRHHPYVERLVDTLEERQGGFTLSHEDEILLRAVAPHFPSIWLTLSQPIVMIVGHRDGDQKLAGEDFDTADRTAFWNEIIRDVRLDYTNVFLRGFLYDHVGLAELHESTHLTIKSKSGVVGTLETETRTGVRQLADELRGEAGTRHVLIRLLPRANEPWDDPHPEPLPVD